MDERAQLALDYVRYEFSKLVNEKWLAIPLNEWGWREPTLGELAEELGITRPALFDRMHGRTPFRAHEMLYLAQRLGIPLRRSF